MSERVDPLWSALAFLIGAAALAGASAITGAGLIHVSTTLNKPAPVVLARKRPRSCSPPWR